MHRSVYACIRLGRHRKLGNIEDYRTIGRHRSLGRQAYIRDYRDLD